VQEAVPGVERHHLDHDAVMTGAERALVGAERHLQVVGPDGHQLVGKVETVGIGQWQVVLAADD
jgi:2-keto-3-deoxy-galactonokinase